MKLRLYRLVERTAAEGPGWRACLWVQGCSIRCPGCFNRHIWDRDGGHDVETAALVERVLAIDDIEGVTFLGGEPFDQAEALAQLGAAVRAGGLSVMTFSGYEHATLASGGRPGWTDLLAVTDLLVDGPYVAALPDHIRPWVGSTNQRFRFLTPRYRHLEPRLASLPDRVEVRLARDGSVWINGMAPAAALGGLRRAVRHVGERR